MLASSTNPRVVNWLLTPETELLLQLALNGHLEHPFHPERNLEVQPGLGTSDVLAEPQHHADLFRIDRVEAGEHDDQGQHHQHDGPDRTAAQVRQLQLAQLAEITKLFVCHEFNLLSGVNH